MSSVQFRLTLRFTLKLGLGLRLRRVGDVVYNRGLFVGEVNCRTRRQARILWLGGGRG